MSRLLLLAVLCLLGWYYFPESRSVLEGAGASLMDPVTRWDARETMERIGRNVVAHERLTGDLPSEDGWEAWLAERYEHAEHVSVDAWGSTYRLRVWDDSVAVVSHGPDGVPGTGDDFQVVMPRG